MKALFVIAGLVLAAAAGAAGGAFITPAPVRKAEPLLPPAAAAAAPVGVSPEVQQRLDSYSMEIADLQAQVAALRQEKSRLPAVAAPEVAAAPESTAVFATLHRDAILKVLADERAEQERKLEEERKQREQQQFQAHADRVATKLNLSTAQKQTLAEFYGNERQRMDDMRTQFRDAQANGTAGAVRDAFGEAREWRTNELTRLFGTELGAQIGQADEDRRGPNAQVNRRGQRNGGGNGGTVGGQGQAPGGG